MLGGTFNPPHRGHLALARHALRELALDRVLLVPARLPPHKTPAEDPGPQARLAMCRLLVAGEPGLQVGTIELDRDTPSYSADTLRELHAAHPQTSHTLILGADMAAALPTWREPAALLELSRLAVALRPGVSPEAVEVALAGLVPPGAPPWPVRFLSMAPLPISSSLVRAKLHRGEPVEELVGAPVARYVAAHGLYRASVAGAPAL
jgi:nicotinate-nucleotide adenylyltransferase